MNQPPPSTTQCSYAVITLLPEQVHLLTMTSPRVMLTGPPGTGKTVVLQLKATEWLRCGSDVFLVCTSDRCAACYRMYYLLQQTIETQLAPTGTPGQLHLLEYRFRTDSDVENAVKDLSQAATGGVLHVIADEMNSSVSHYLQVFHEELLTRVPHLHFWAESYYPESVPSSWQVQNLTRPIRFPETVKMELEHIRTVAGHNSKTYSRRGEYESQRGPPVQRFPLPRHKGSHRSTRRINRCVTCGEHVAKILMDVLAGVPGQGNITTSTAIAPTSSDTTSVRLQYRDVLVLPSIHVRYFMDLETGLRKAGIPVRYMTRDNLEDIVTAREDEVVVADEEDVRGLERKVVVVIVDELEDAGRLATSRCTSQLVYIIYRDEVCGVESDTNVEETQEKERRKCEASATCSKKGAEDTEIQKDTNSKCYSFLFKIKLDLREAAGVTPPQHIMESGCPRDDRTEEVSDTSDDTLSSPIFSDHWQVRGCFSAAGGRLQKQGSDVVLQVPAGAVDVNTKVTVHAAVCANDVYIKHKLQLPSTKTIVSPLAEFSASTDLPFQKHVQITLPTCLSSNYNVHTCHVYCIRSEKPEGQITISELERLEELSETSKKEKPAAYFYVNGKGQVVVMTTHFSGYVCTSCFQCQNLSLDVYASHRHEHGEVRVFLRAELWDRLNLREFKKCNPGNSSYRLVLRETFQLRKMFTPAELLMELTVSDEQQNMWQHIKFQDVLPETKKTFQLNWDKIECTKCINLPAIKYTELGPFYASWMLKSPEGVTPSTLEVCVRVSHSQIQGHLEPDSSCAPIEIDVRPYTEDENRFSNGSCDRTTINIQNLLGDLHLAPQPSSTG